MIQNTSFQLTYTAWNSGDGSLCTGDASNHSCFLSANGGALTAASNSPIELGNGLYALTLTAAETNTDLLTLSVTSSTSGVVVPPVQVAIHDPEPFKADVSSVASNVWSASNRSLTDSVSLSASAVSSLSESIWNASNRSLTNFVNLSASTVSSIAENVWNSSSRSLTDSVTVSTDSVSSIQNGLSTSFELASVSEKVDSLSSVSNETHAFCTSISTETEKISEACTAIQIRTNLIPDRPAAIGSAMTLTDSYSNLLQISPSSIAAAVLEFDISHVEASAPPYSLCTIILAHLQSSVDGSSWTIYRTDGVTQHAVRNLTATDDSAPITGVFAP